MAKREGTGEGEKLQPRSGTAKTKLDSEMRAKADKPRSATSRTTVNNLRASYGAGGGAQKAAPLWSRSITAGKPAKVMKTKAKKRPKQINKRGVDAAKVMARKELEAALAHHDRPITAAEAKRMMELIRADRPTPELRPRRR
ncbi:hypothetical protein [Streptomyces sp. NPDC058579]|uniref:hypothetical protein n=1 Tax=Streptomyces sp. NPDC058579 TaxID=3346548 RepID=UPI00365ECEAD